VGGERSREVKGAQWWKEQCGERRRMVQRVGGERCREVEGARW